MSVLWLCDGASFVANTGDCWETFSFTDLARWIFHQLRCGSCLLSTWYLMVLGNQSRFVKHYFICLFVLLSTAHIALYTSLWTTHIALYTCLLTIHIAVNIALYTVGEKIRATFWQNRLFSLYQKVHANYRLGTPMVYFRGHVSWNSKGLM